MKKQNIMKKKIILAKSDIEKMVVECVKEIQEENKDVPTDNLFEYFRLRPSDTGLNVNIFIDDSAAYRRNGHPLWVYTQNDYNDISNVIAIDVESSNQIVLSPKNIGVSFADYQKVLKYINQNRELIIRLADGVIDHLEYEEKQTPIRDNISMNREQTLYEMATLSPQKSGLPTILWLDEGVPSQHGPRIKFKASAEQHLSNDFSSMSICSNPVVYNMPAKASLRKKDIERIRNFVIANSELLLSLSCGKIKYTDFLRKMERV